MAGDRRNCKQARIISNEDVISTLPDAILAHILSFIDTQRAVATSILAKRWKLVWVSVPNLHFDFYHEWDPNYPLERADFENFVDRVLSLNKVSSVRNVSLCCCEDSDVLRVNAWFQSLVVRDAVKFDLSLPSSCLVDELRFTSSLNLNLLLPDKFFNQKTLVKLRLSNVVLKVPPLVGLPCLKSVRLDSVQFYDDKSLPNLLSGCPVLRILTIKRMVWYNAQTLHISSSTLDSLDVITWYCDKPSGYDVVIDAPKLTSIYLNDRVSANYDVINLSSLVTANLFIEEDNRVLSKNGDGFRERLLCLLRKFIHVKELKLSTRTLRYFETVSLEYLPKFDKLTKITVAVYAGHGSSTFPRLFHCMPKIVTLVFLVSELHPDCEWEEPAHDVPQCLSSNIENIEISYAQGCEEQIKMAAYILKNALVLKELCIYSADLSFIEEVSFYRELLPLPRSSAVCQVKYFNISLENSGNEPLSDDD